MKHHIFYMAAGNSRRFGGNKLLFLYEGKRLFEYGLETVRAVADSRPDCDLIVVTQYGEIREYCRNRGIRAVDSPQSVHGMSYTIRAGISSIQPEAEDDMLFVVADQPKLSAATLQRLLDAGGQEKCFETASVMYRGQPGNPTRISCRFIPELLALQGDEGGRKVIRKHRCIYVEAADAQELVDIDVLP